MTPTEWDRIVSHFNTTAKCRRRKDSSPKVEHEPGCTFVQCEHKNCVCVMNFHGDEPLSESLARWQNRHG